MNAPRAGGGGACPPRVSIGLPVRDGEPYLAAALESLLAQTFGDFEIVVCDNASTDATGAIARHYAGRDARVRYERNPVNIGGGPNHDRVFALARGAYFKWAAHDDVHAPGFLAAAVAALDADPGLTLAYAPARPIGPDGGVLHPTEVGAVTVGGRRRRFRREPAPWPAAPEVARRFRSAVDFLGAGEIYGLMRRQVLASAELLGAYYGADRVLVARLSLLGRFAVLPEGLFLKRLHADQSVALPRYRDRAVWNDPEAARQHGIAVIARGYARAVSVAPLSRRERAACRAIVARWILRRTAGALARGLRVRR